MGVLSTKDPLAEWLGTTTDTSFYLPIHSYNHTLHNISLGSVFLFNRPCLSLCLFISLTLTTWTASSRSSLFSYSILCVNSLLFIYLLHLYLVCVQFLFEWWENSGKGEKSKIYFWFLFFFLFSCFIFEFLLL